MEQTLKRTSITTEISSFVPTQRQDRFSCLPPENQFHFNPFDSLSHLCPNALCDAILDVLPYGILVVNRAYHCLYANAKAQELCQSLSCDHQTLAIVPQLIQEACNSFYEARKRKAEPSPMHDDAVEPLVMEYLGKDQKTIRIKVQNLSQFTKNNRNSNSAAPILVLLEDYNEKFKIELAIECKKYLLTERETDVWNLLKQGYTYQEIAHHLHLSLNTIKTHTKNINSKRRTYHQTNPTVWFSH